MNFIAAVAKGHAMRLQLFLVILYKIRCSCVLIHVLGEVKGIDVICTCNAKAKSATQHVHVTFVHNDKVSYLLLV